jgi:hypothetical protein
MHGGSGAAIRGASWRNAAVNKSVSGSEPVFDIVNVVDRLLLTPMLEILSTTSLSFEPVRIASTTKDKVGKNPPGKIHLRMKSTSF